MAKSHTCIRVYADQNQIDNCRIELERTQPSISKLAKVLNLAGNEVRLKILYLLVQEGEMCPCDLSDVLSMTVPAISQHLRKLKDAGVVYDNKVGQTIFYKISKDDRPLIKSLLKEVNEELV